MPERRQLVFESLDEVMPDVERLVPASVTAGRWSLAQILWHLARAIRLTLKAPRGTGSTVTSDALKARFFRHAAFPVGVAIPVPGLDPPSDCELTNAVAALQQAITELATASGPFGPHPLLGPLSDDEWRRFHCIHCAHHLSFASPASA